MDFSQLRTIGLTQGEIAVYEALTLIGQTSTGKLMKQAQISSSKIYLILDKLIKKGLVSSILIEGVHQYQTTNPKTILDYIESRKDELVKVQKNMELFIPSIQALRKTTVEESAQLYKGLKGIKSSYLKILDELEDGEEYRIFAVSGSDVAEKRIRDFLRAFHRKRIDRNVTIRIIVDSGSVDLYTKNNPAQGKFELRKHPLTLPVGLVVGRNRIITLFFGRESLSHEIVSVDIAKKYQDYFDKLWDSSEFCLKKD